MSASLRILDSDPSSGTATAFGFEPGVLNAPSVWLDNATAALGSFEALEILSTFASRAHSLSCCPCGQDHSNELLAFKIALFGGANGVGVGLAAESVLNAPYGSPEFATTSIPGEVAGNTSTTRSLAIGDSVISQIETSLDQDWYRVQLQAGVTYVFTLNGTGGDALTDPYLEMMSASGQQLKFDDDGGDGLNAQLRFTPTTSGTYFVNAHGWVNTNGTPDNTSDDFSSTGQYTLSATQAAALATYSVDQIADYLVNEGSSAGSAWLQTNITYNISALTSEQQILAERALSVWAAVTPLTFTRTTGTGNITFRNTNPNPDASDPTAAAAFAQNTFSGAGFITASTIVVTSNWFGSDTTYDSYTQQTYIHEVGHALGLGHAGPYNGTADWGTDNIYTNDNWANTVMSYFDQLESGHGSYRFVLGLQQADIAAIQNLYGSRPGGTFAGNTTFGFNSSAPGTNIDWSQFVLVQPEGTYKRPPSMTIYDTGGIDTINLSGFSQPQLLDLSPGSFSSLGDRPIVGQVHYTNVLSIAADTIIENAIGGSGNDTIIGNAAANLIEGGAGADSLSGGAGQDIVSYSSSSAGVTLYLSSQAVFGGHATGDVLSSFEGALGSAFQDVLYGSDVSNDLNGGGGDDYLYGFGGNDILVGGAGNDVLVGGAGADVLDGGDGEDWFYVDGLDTGVFGGAGLDRLFMTDASGQAITLTNSEIELVWGNIGNDVIDVSGNVVDVQYVIGDFGDDLIIGSNGVDLIIGGYGNDIVKAGAGDDWIYLESEDTIFALDGGAGIDRLFVSSGIGVSWDVTSSNIEAVFGFTGNDTLTYLGNESIYIEGGSGNDTIRGGGGNDTLIGGSGADSLRAGAGLNILYGGSDADTFVFESNAGSSVNYVQDFGPEDVLRLVGFGFANALQAAGFFTQSGTAVIFDQQGVRLVIENSSVAAVQGALEVGQSSASAETSKDALMQTSLPRDAFNTDTPHAADFFVGADIDAFCPMSNNFDFFGLMNFWNEIA